MKQIQHGFIFLVLQNSINTLKVHVYLFAISFSHYDLQPKYLVLIGEKTGIFCPLWMIMVAVDCWQHKHPSVNRAVVQCYSQRHVEGTVHVTIKVCL